ncbi:MAG TPA: aminodeoxychorismate synthase component I [Pyrinomonadaceae bacterium]|jgi:para-aminobenzoate synthetase component 1
MRSAIGTTAEIHWPPGREIALPVDELLRALLALAPGRRLGLLDSGGSRGAEARLLIAGFDPTEIIEASGPRLLIETHGRDGHRVERGEVLSLLDERLAGDATKSQKRARQFPAGACIATLSYELGQRLAGLSSVDAPPAPGGEPDAVLAFYDTLVVHDYARGRTRIVSAGSRQRLAETEEAINDAARRIRVAEEGCEGLNPGPRDTPPVASNMTREQYVVAVGRIKEHIAAGDIYQANLTQQLSCPLDPRDGPEQVFMRLRREHPSSFGAFIRRREDVVISASPERFLRVETGEGGRRVEAWPIKGTRPRGRSARADARLRAELLASEKDRAENVMIVDLLRNDLGRVCRYGSVEVLELCALQEHPTLFHLVSRVGGRLRNEVTAAGLLRAAFPCGSITGAPKIRAMEIIKETESVPRGLSMGAIGYLSSDGSLDLSVAIRTMVVRDGRARFNVGGGIVADSRAEYEYEESLVKARALLRSLGAETFNGL